MPLGAAGLAHHPSPAIRFLNAEFRSQVRVEVSTLRRNLYAKFVHNPGEAIPRLNLQVAVRYGCLLLSGRLRYGQ